MQIKRIPITSIRAAVYNPRKDLQPGDAEYEKLKRSIERFDMVEPLVWNRKTKNLVGGHQRLKVLKAMGVKQVEVSVVNLGDADEKALNVALNKISGDWDLGKLKGLLEGLDKDGYDISLTGFDEKELRSVMEYGGKPGKTDDDAAPEVPAKPVTKLGDLYVLGNHRLYCGDATKNIDVTALILNDKAHILFTDPPYGLGGYAGRGKHSKTPVKNDDKDPAIFYQCLPKCQEMYVWGLVRNCRDINFDPRDVIVWRKNNIGMGRGYRGQYEVCFYSGEFNGSDSDVWDVAKDKNYVHPTQKPVELILRALVNSSKTGDIVLDLFGGSGSTMIACEKMGRRCLTMELDPAYCDVIVKRWEDFTGKKAVRKEASVASHL